MTADHSGANKHWMNQRNLMRASIRNHRVYLYIRNNPRYIIAQHMSKGRVALQVKTRRTSKHLTNAFGRKSLSFFSVGTFTLPKSLLDGRVRFKGPISSSRRPMFTGECITVKFTGTVRWCIRLHGGNLLTPCKYLDTLCHNLEKFQARHMS